MKKTSEPAGTETDAQGGCERPVPGSQGPLSDAHPEAHTARTTVPKPTRRFDWATLRSEAPEGQDDVAQPIASAARPTASTTRASAPHDAGDASIILRVNDLKQYAYCPRVVFYQYAMPVQQKATFKMERGKDIESVIERLEKRRTLREYGLAGGTREFQVQLSSANPGLAGRLDLMITTADGLFPVDFKDTRGPVHHNHRVQLCGYALLMEDIFQRPVSAGFIYRVPRDAVTAVEMIDELRRQTLACIVEIRQMIRNERMPAATPVRARCCDCEYRNYCGDVF